MLARLKSDVFAYKPEVLFIMGGTNDLGQNISQATTIANLRAIIVAASAKGIRIDLMTIPPDAYPDMAAEDRLTQRGDRSPRQHLQARRDRHPHPALHIDGCVRAEVHE